MATIELVLLFDESLVIQDGRFPDGMDPRLLEGFGFDTCREK